MGLDYTSKQRHCISAQLISNHIDRFSITSYKRTECAFFRRWPLGVGRGGSMRVEDVSVAERERQRNVEGREFEGEGKLGRVFRRKVACVFYLSMSFSAHKENHLPSPSLKDVAKKEIK